MSLSPRPQIIEPMEAAIYSWAAFVAHVTTFLIVAFRVIMRKPAVGVALSWLLLVGVIPGVGVLFYLLVGERRVGQRRAKRIAQLHTDYSLLADRMVDPAMTNVDWSQHSQAARGMDRLGHTMLGIPTVAGSSGQLYTDSAEILKQMAADIDAAETSILMEFYIWNAGGLADDVTQALIRAAQRGVVCRVLVDAVGGSRWWKSEQPAQLREAGVKVLPAFPAGIWQVVFSRNDLRLHRKIVVIDGSLAWTGSMNLVDPRFFKQDAGVGEWVDAMVRGEGAAVAPLAMTVIGDWIVESDETIEQVMESTELSRIKPQGVAAVQVIPSGPVETSDTLLQMLLAVINSAQEELVLTTPYFVPDESLLRAICGAAGRGVKVHLIIPERVDSLLTRYASRSYLEELIDVGVQVHLFKQGLLHTKSVTADRSISMFGTVNLDMRSIWLNYEVSLFVYGKQFGEHLYNLQRQYMEQSDRLDPETWAARPMREKLLENTLRLMSPVL
ncbi:cardiolipin synthase [Aeoliella sp. ICT_H6.2]|uniref:Cardiolipin synthase n=1 Tax=Aeoliella straminimaris TaxID=2954799 RepID=A0A9X2JIC5_9BACT|nr:cardiolipin synthase [Aeoliella straminimaris]